MDNLDLFVAKFVYKILTNPTQMVGRNAYLSLGVGDNDVGNGGGFYSNLLVANILLGICH